jgi:hypothetical protein
MPINATKPETTGIMSHRLCLRIAPPLCCPKAEPCKTRPANTPRADARVERNVAASQSAWRERLPFGGDRQFQTGTLPAD